MSRGAVLWCFPGMTDKQKVRQRLLSLGLGEEDDEGKPQKANDRSQRGLPKEIHTSECEGEELQRASVGD